MNKRMSPDVTKFLDKLKHPLQKEIDLLRSIILNANANLIENIKWNGPNYSISDQDRITMKINPPKNIQLIFHRGAKVQKQQMTRIVSNSFDFLQWKENDRAIATFKNLDEIKMHEEQLTKLVQEWIKSSL